MRGGGNGGGGGAGGGDGCGVPLVFRRIGVDPAVASGPLITTLNDGLSLLLYFGIAAFFL